ncbi:unnamed protein product [Thlaspi arvense]|uniref:Uncharacterized protein n=1 Tax=Thlaspi arvense TaxID=13288 RepID=A0AAU9SHT2_THLAR|nr:unnamed protein product [Thlaspi arvense]
MPNKSIIRQRIQELVTNSANKKRNLSSRQEQETL